MRLRVRMLLGGKMNKMVLAFFIILFLTACSTGNAIVNEVPVPESSVQEHIANAKEFNVVAKNWKFDPETINVNEGDSVLLHIQSIDVEHGFALPDFNVDVKLHPGETIDVEFTADKKGEFTFYCDVFCGEGHNHMKGKLVVK